MYNPVEDHMERLKMVFYPTWNNGHWIGLWDGGAEIYCYAYNKDDYGKLLGVLTRAKYIIVSQRSFNVEGRDYWEVVAKKSTPDATLRPYGTIIDVESLRQHLRWFNQSGCNSTGAHISTSQGRIRELKCPDGLVWEIDFYIVPEPNDIITYDTVINRVEDAITQARLPLVEPVWFLIGWKGMAIYAKPTTTRGAVKGKFLMYGLEEIETKLKSKYKQTISQLERLEGRSYYRHHGRSYPSAKVNALQRDAKKLKQALDEIEHAKRLAREGKADEAWKEFMQILSKYKYYIEPA